MRRELLSPERVEQAVDLVNRKIDALAHPSPPSAKATEVGRLEQEVARLAEALAKGTAYETIADALAAKERLLKEARAELAAPVPLPRIPKVTAAEVRERMSQLWHDIGKLDGERSRSALQQVFEGTITVTPLGGAWTNGWRLEMRTRPWAVLLPRGVFAQLVGCGGRI